MSNLYEASAQWATRPDDERFADLPSLFEATKAHAMSACVGNVRVGELNVRTVEGNNLALVGPQGNPATLTHYAFGQLAAKAEAPAGYLRRLPAELAQQNLTHGLSKMDQSDKLNILFHKNGRLVTRSIMTDSYDRVWNHEVISAIQRNLVPEGWVVPPARPCRPGQKGTRKATAADILPNQGDFGLAVKVGDDIAPAGLYASDHDMFAFMVNHTDPVSEGSQLLNRGVFVSNSEVGAGSLWLKLFLYDNVCGNHIVWGVHKVTEVSVRHVKSDRLTHGNTLRNAVSKWRVAVNQMSNTGQMEAGIQAAKAYTLGANKEEVLDALFGFAKKKGLNTLTKATLEAGYDLAEKTPRYGSPRSVWGMVNGLTEYSQSTPFTDVRNEMDVQAGRVMEIAF